MTGQSAEQYKYRVKWSSRFKKDYKLAIKRGYDISLIDEVIRLIAMGDQQKKLIDEYDDHELGLEIFNKLFSGIDRNRSRAIVTFISCDYRVHITTDGCGDHDGILVIVVFISNCVLTIYAECIEKFKQSKKLCYYSAAFFVHVFFFLELLSGKVVDVCNLLCCNATDDLFICYCEKNLFSGITPWLPILKYIDDDISV